MKFCRFQFEDRVHYGAIENIGGHEIVNLLAGDPFGPEIEATLTQLPLEDIKLLAPVVPSKIVCVGRNYREHAQELGNPVPVELLTFLKPPSSIIGPDEPIVRPTLTERLDYEGELAMVIGRQCRHLSAKDDVRQYIRGYSCLNDVTARDLQRGDGQWTRGKGFDTFCPVGPVVSDELDPWAGVQVQTRVNGELRQDGNTRDFIFSLEEILRYITRFMTLYPGDLIPTGTPAGVGELHAGDVVEITVQGVGTLRNPVVDEPRIESG